MSEKEFFKGLGLSPATQEKYGSAQALFNRDRENDLNNYFNKRLYPATFYNSSS